jgi:hypothetical protein
MLSCVCCVRCVYYGGSSVEQTIRTVQLSHAGNEELLDLLMDLDGDDVEDGEEEDEDDDEEGEYDAEDSHYDQQAQSSLATKGLVPRSEKKKVQKQPCLIRISGSLDQHVRL